MGLHHQSEAIKQAPRSGLQAGDHSRDPPSHLRRFFESRTPIHKPQAFESRTPIHKPQAFESRTPINTLQAFELRTPIHILQAFQSRTPIHKSQAIKQIHKPHRFINPTPSTLQTRTPIHKPQAVKQAPRIGLQTRDHSRDPSSQLHRFWARVLLAHPSEKVLLLLKIKVPRLPSVKPHFQPREPGPILRSAAERRGDTMEYFDDFSAKPWPESGIDCHIYATFAQQWVHQFLENEATSSPISQFTYANSGP